MTDPDARRPAIISTLDNDQNLIITIQPSHRRNETVIGQVKVKAETVTYAQGIIQTSSKRIVARRRSITVHPQHLTSHRRRVLGLLILMELANHRVQLTIRPELDVTTVMVDRVRCRAHNLKQVKSTGASVASGRVSDDVSVRIEPAVAIRVVDVNILVGRKGRIKCYAQEPGLAIMEEIRDSGERSR